MNKLLHNAKRNQLDEFYTLYKDIEEEINAYTMYNPNVFKDKTVLLPCDNPDESNFTKFFLQNFNKFGLKKLISSGYNKYGEGNKLIYDGINTNCFTGDGDFRSDEVRRFINESDFIITNPPFSLFREFLKQITEANKQFLIIGNINCLTYKEVFLMIQQNKVWLGTRMGRQISGFIVPEGYELYGSEARIENGNRIVATNNCLWLTNIDHGKRHQQLKLMSMADNIKYSKHKKVKGHEYRKYDNFEAIEVPFTDAIPSDYEGAMGVPVTFLCKYNPEQFEIIGFRKGTDNKDLSINKKSVYCRILIKRK